MRSKTQNKPKIAITTGCPCGIGPEIVAKASNDKRVLEACEPIVIGQTDVNNSRLSAEQCGAASAEALDEAIKLAMSGEVKAIVTAPINKSHWKAAEIPFPGHTEYIAHVTGSKSVAMMMHSPRLIVTLATTHLALADVPRSITVEKICEVTRLTHEFISTHALGDPRTRALTPIAICGLNPHAGDSGVFGNEERNIIIPAIEIMRANGLNVSGPHPADTVFWQASQGKYAAVVSMYHDQGLCAVKTLDFEHTVNVTLGLPFVRTSPDHGTADDIAGKGIADHNNMVEAILLAARQ